MAKSEVNESSIDDVTVLESLCLKCHEQGTTRLLITRIPFHRDVVVSSFLCPHCGNRDGDLMAAQTIQDKAVKYTLKLEIVEDLNRTVVRTNQTVIKIPELDFEIPPTEVAADVTTVESVLSRAISDLQLNQPERRTADADVADKLDEFIGKLSKVLALDMPATFVVDDLSGNCFVENPNAPAHDPRLTVLHYSRTAQQDAALGIAPALTGDDDEEVQKTDGACELVESRDDMATFVTSCSKCGRSCSTNMKLIAIPYFKEVVLIATNCDHCGFRTSEVKSSGPTSEKGKRMTLKVTSTLDLNRDVLKSDTCVVEIPELEVEAGAAVLSSRFTTVEGLLAGIKDSLETNPVLLGDSRTTDKRDKLTDICSQLQDAIDLKLPVTVVMDDPAGNSYLQDLYVPEPDPYLICEEYERSYEQNELLGLNDMKIENYNQPHQSDTK